MDNVRVRVKQGCEGVIVIDFVIVLIRPSTSKQAQASPDRALHNSPGRQAWV